MFGGLDWIMTLKCPLKIAMHARVTKNLPPQAPFSPWPLARTPWARIHIDYAEKDNQMFLLVIDALVVLGCRL